MNLVLKKFEYYLDGNSYISNKANIGGAVYVKNYPFTFSTTMYKSYNNKEN